MPWLAIITWARMPPALASATPRSRYLKNSRRPLTSTGSAMRAWATFWAGALVGFLAAADGICSSLAMAGYGQCAAGLPRSAIGQPCLFVLDDMRQRPAHHRHHDEHRGRGDRPGDHPGAEPHLEHGPVPAQDAPGGNAGHQEGHEEAGAERQGVFVKAVGEFLHDAGDNMVRALSPSIAPKVPSNVPCIAVPDRQAARRRGPEEEDRLPRAARPLS